MNIIINLNNIFHVQRASLTLYEISNVQLSWASDSSDGYDGIATAQMNGTLQKRTKNSAVSSEKTGAI